VRSRHPVRLRPRPTLVVLWGAGRADWGGQAGASHYEDKIVQFADILERRTAAHAEELQGIVRNMSNDSNTIYSDAMSNIVNVVGGLGAIEKLVGLLRLKDYTRALDYVKENGTLPLLLDRLGQLKEKFS
jgi:hypothetical protein